jgi:hypothetical protein
MVAAAPAAFADPVPVCGTNVAGQPITGALTLNTQNSHTTQPLGMSSSPNYTIDLDFSVAGCTLPPGVASNLRINPVLPASDAVDVMPPKAFHWDVNDDIDPERTTLAVTLHIDPNADGFGPGTYKAIVRISDLDVIAESQTPILITRSTHFRSEVMAVALLGAFVGLMFALAGVIAKAEDKKRAVTFRDRWMVVACLFAIGAGLAAYLSDYQASSVAVWNLGDDWKKTGGDAFAYTSSSTVAAILAVAAVSTAVRKVKSQGTTPPES